MGQVRATERSPIRSSARHVDAPGRWRDSTRSYPGRSLTVPRSGKAHRKVRVTREKSAEVIVCAGQRENQVGSSPTGARMQGAISKRGGNASWAAQRAVWRAGCRSRGRIRRACGAVLGRNRRDEPVGQSQGAVEPALWRRRHIASPLAHQGVCGRHGTEDFRVTPGDLGAFIPVRG